jgi:FkbM family methyltransferase
MSIVGRLSRLILRLPALWLVPAAALHPSHRCRRLRSALIAARFTVWTCVLRQPSKVRIGECSTVIGRPGEFNPLHAVVRNPPNSEMLVWREWLRQGDLFIDVGANIGLYTIYAVERGARTIAVEPDPVNAERIRENLAANGYRAEVIEMAADAVAGTVGFTTHLNERNHLITDGRQGRCVAATTLDDLIGERTAMVKIDVEGAEDRVLRGAERALAERRIPLLQLEWGLDDQSVIGDRSSLLPLLRDHGYALFRADHAGGLHPLGDQSTTDLNVFAMPVENDQR